MIEASPALMTPDPMALETTSKKPPMTGVPSDSPVIAAASPVTWPTMSADSTQRGKNANASSIS